MSGNNLTSQLRESKTVVKCVCVSLLLCTYMKMAETSISVSKDEFSCSVCLQLLKDPVTLPCGHSYCMSCISDCWNKGDHKGVYSCPQCRNTFTSRPALNKNTILAVIVEKLETKDHNDLASITVNSLHSHREELGKLSDTVKHTEIILVPEPKTREQLLQYSHQLTLDQNTLHKRLCLSEGNRTIAVTGRLWQHDDHPERFDALIQVLSRERVCGRSYWEVKWSGDVGISVSYKSISRKGRGHECEFGRNDQSWSLHCSDSRCSFWHNNIQTKLHVLSKSCRIGVYVDDSAGTLSFYSISDTVTLIHSIQTTFTQPLFPGFRLHLNCKVTLCDLTM